MGHEKIVRITDQELALEFEVASFYETNFYETNFYVTNFYVTNIFRRAK